jgi:hypothetical protein
VEYSEYIVYVDESGDHTLEKDDPNYPLMVLAFCIFKKSDYTSTVSPQLQTFKFNHFGHDAVVLHERDIRKQSVPFKFLQNRQKREKFMDDLNTLMSNIPVTVIAAVINKPALRERYSSPQSPYKLALQFCLERTRMFLNTKRQIEKMTHLIFECRGAHEDKDLELEFRRICDGGNFENTKFGCFDIRFADKKTNSAGLQIADLIARPIGRHQLTPDQPNRAYEIISSKFYRKADGTFEGAGLKSFP